MPDPITEKTNAEIIIRSLRDPSPDKFESKLSEPRTGKELLDLTRLDPMIDMTAPPIVITINMNGITAPFGTLGNISVLSGKAKSKKTMVAAMITAAAINNTKDSIISCSFPEGKSKIVLFDTEQGDYHVWKSVMRTFNIAGGTREALKESLDVFCLRSLSPEERLTAIDYYLETTPGVGLVIIDGVRDLLHDINDSTQANYAAQKLMTWSKDYFVHIMIALHQNKGDGNLRGHIGTEITNKAETVADIVKDKNDPTISTVEAKDCRNIEFEKFAFAIDQYGVPRLIDDYKDLSEAKESKTKYPSDIDNNVHRQVLIKVFTSEPVLSYSKLIPAIKVGFGSLKVMFGDNAARDFIAYYKQVGMVKFQKSGNKNEMEYSFNPMYVPGPKVSYDVNDEQLPF